MALPTDEAFAYTRRDGAPGGWANHRGTIVRLSNTTPILRIFDEAKAREFYVEFLGFEVDWEHRFDANAPLYLQVSRAGCLLHLSEHHGDCCPGAAVRIEVDDLEALEAELQAKAYRYYRPAIEEMPWGTRDLTVKDPFGNRLTFTNAIYAR